MTSKILVNVVQCPRCNGCHDRLRFVAFKNAIETAFPEFTHWSVCPTTNEPVLVSNRTAVDKTKPYGKVKGGDCNDRA